MLDGEIIKSELSVIDNGSDRSIKKVYKGVSLPNEIWNKIAELLDAFDIQALAQTNSLINSYIIHLFDRNKSRAYSRIDEKKTVMQQLFQCITDSDEYICLILKNNPEFDQNGYYIFDYIYNNYHIHNYLNNRILRVLLFTYKNRYYPNGSTILHLAAHMGNIDIVSDLINRCNISIEIKDTQGIVPLVNAIYSLKIDIVRLLVKLGANINTITNLKNRQSALHIAVEKNSLQIVVILLNGGADPNVIAMDGKTPLHYINKNTEQEMIRILVKWGANINIQSFDGTTPFHQAVKLGCIENAKLFLKLGAEFNTQDGNGQSPLHNIIRFNHYDLLTILIKKEVNMNCADSEGKTPVHYAMRFCSNAVRNLVASQLGADFTYADKTGCTPYGLAMEYISTCPSKLSEDFRRILEDTLKQQT